MEIFLNSILFFLGLVVLILGSDWLIQSSVKLSIILRLSTVFVGLIFVSFGTSTPEAGVSIVAAFKNQGAIAVGNVLGSNIANIGLIVGLCGMFVRLKVDPSLFKRDMPLMLIATGLLYVFSLDLKINFVEGIVFLVLFVIFIFSAIRGEKGRIAEETEEFYFRFPFTRIQSKSLIALSMVVSLILVFLGAHFMVKSGVKLADIFGISPWIVGVTVFAVGTSLPELAASMTAAVKKMHGISLGNIVGSNVFNILFVLGVASLIRPLELERDVLYFEFPCVLIFSVVLLIFMKTKETVSRLESIVLFGSYILFLVTLFVR